MTTGIVANLPNMLNYSFKMLAVSLKVKGMYRMTSEHFRETAHVASIKAEEGEWKDAKVGTAWQEAKRKTKEGLHG